MFIVVSGNNLLSEGWKIADLELSQSASNTFPNKWIYETIPSIASKSYI